MILLENLYTLRQNHSCEINSSNDFVCSMMQICKLIMRVNNDSLYCIISMWLLFFSSYSSLFYIDLKSVV